MDAEQFRNEDLLLLKAIPLGVLRVLRAGREHHAPFRLMYQGVRNGAMMDIIGVWNPIAQSRITRNQVISNLSNTSGSAKSVQSPFGLSSSYEWRRRRRWLYDLNDLQRVAFFTNENAADFDWSKALAAWILG